MDEDEKLVKRIIELDLAGEHDKAEALEALLWMRRSEADGSN